VAKPCAHNFHGDKTGSQKMMPILTLRILPAVMLILCLWLLIKLGRARPVLSLLIFSTAARCIFYEASMWRTTSIATEGAACLMLLAVVETMARTFRSTNYQGNVPVYSLAIGCLVAGFSLVFGAAEEPYRAFVQLWGFVALFASLLMVILTWWEGYERGAVWIHGFLAAYILAAIVSSRREAGAEWWTNTLVTESLQILAIGAMIFGGQRKIA
jgi:hypothetical protein